MVPALGTRVSQSTALLLIAHGSREDDANADTRYLACELAARGPFGIVVAAFLELAEPDIDAGAARCLEQGARRVVLLPHFLSAGTHVRRDLAAARDGLAARHPGAEFCLAEPLGRHSLLLSVLIDRALQAIAGAGD